MQIVGRLLIQLRCAGRGCGSLKKRNDYLDTHVCERGEAISVITSNEIIYVPQNYSAHNNEMQLLLSAPHSSPSNAANCLCERQSWIQLQLTKEDIMAKVSVVAIFSVFDMKTCNLGVRADHDHQILARTLYILRNLWSALCSTRAS